VSVSLDVGKKWREHKVKWRELGVWLAHFCFTAQNLFRWREKVQSGGREHKTCESIRKCRIMCRRKKTKGI